MDNVCRNDVVQQQRLEQGVSELGLFLKQSAGLLWVGVNERLHLCKYLEKSIGWDPSQSGGDAVQRSHSSMHRLARW